MKEILMKRADALVESGDFTPDVATEAIAKDLYDNMCRDCDATNQMEYCENDCGEICGNCNWLGEADLEAVKECQTHNVYLETKVPEYRKAEA